jgi:hypothetical protein
VVTDKNYLGEAANRTDIGSREVGK